MKVKIFGVELASNSSPKAVFEKVSKKAQDIQGLYYKFSKNNSPFFILSTCQRLALFTVGTCPGKSIHFFEELGVKKKYLNTYKKDGAAEYLFSISAGLQSANIGESEILNQLKNTLYEARQNKSLDAILQKLLQKAIEVGKKVRTETSIVNNNESYPAIINKLLLKNFKEITSKNILVIGNGKLGNSCIHYFLNKKNSITLATRNPKKIDPLLEDRTLVIPRDNIKNVLFSFDIVIGAASLVDPILTTNNFQNNKRNIFLVDLGSPANFSQDISGIDQVTLYSLEDIFRIGRKIKHEKVQSIEDANKIINLETHEFSNWLKSRKAAKIIHTLKEELEQIKSEEHVRRLNDLSDLDIQQQKIVEMMVERLTSRIAHTHYSHIKDFVVNDQS